MNTTNTVPPAAGRYGAPLKDRTVRNRLGDTFERSAFDSLRIKSPVFGVVAHLGPFVAAVIEAGEAAGSSFSHPVGLGPRRCTVLGL